MKVKDLKAKNFEAALIGIWHTKSETANRVKQRCNAVMDWCVAQDLINGNPVGAVSKLLGPQIGRRERVNHQPSMPWVDIPVFMEEVVHAGNQSLSKVMLEFLILTAARSSEVRGMTWNEVDLKEAVWTLPAERMKAKKAHRIPLSNRAIEILKSQKDKEEHPELVFPTVRGKLATDMTLTKWGVPLQHMVSGLASVTGLLNMVILRT